ncbi:lipopolysaccharide assembly protein LapB [Dyadobacter sp. CY343]|uniref:tetratricopeptide repeat protein n=1 Tax=Dyadobacter sp. CY343 TaxID=2907299 RepID=UPI001F2B47A1|nr:tetratricopeptide repeat protein [Dyadobacter sp. CY343]MCE7060524.1 tetratricopeptide repeat protein [Dyadobacter sp. CY343]
MKSAVSGYLIFLITIALGGLLQSCQSDARNATRIPPVVKKSRAQWQNDAVLSLTELINRGIDSDINYFKRARIYFEREQYNEALDDINESIYEQDNVSDYFLLRGRINRELGKIDNALEDAQRAEALQQSSPELYVLLADILQAKNRFGESVGYLNQALKMAPYDGPAYYVKGMLQARQGDSLSALASLDYAINVNPRMLRAYQQSILLLRRLKNIEKALQVNQKAIESFPNDPNLHYEQGQIFVAMARPDTALFSFQKAVSLSPDYEDALLQIANIGIQLKAYQKAIPALLKLVKKKPQSKEINNMLGLCYEKNYDYENAKTYYSTALALAPGDQDARYGLYRIRLRENEENSYQSYYPDENPAASYKLLDTARVKINVLKPRGTTNIRVDSTRKAKIE